MSVYERELASYRRLNEIAKKNGVVLFGSSFAKDIPVCELKQAFELDCDIYNRSFTDLSVFDAKELLDECVLKLAPHKVLLQMGETDLERGYHTIPEIVAEYEKTVNEIKKADKYCDVIVVSVCDNGSGVYPEELNKQLEAMADRCGCKYADITPAFANESPTVKAFSMLKRFMRDRISFCDTVSMLNV